MDEAREWLRTHPGEDRVAAAMQRLEEREERLTNPDSAPNWSGEYNGVRRCRDCHLRAALCIERAVDDLRYRWRRAFSGGYVADIRGDDGIDTKHWKKPERKMTEANK